MREVKLPSGATLRVASAPFSASKALYQAVLKELKAIPIPAFAKTAGVENMLKDAFCTGFSSPEIDARLVPCLERCMYEWPGEPPQKIDGDTFEKVERRQDYLFVLKEVLTENVGPFGKSLYAEYKGVMGQLEKLSTPS